MYVDKNVIYLCILTLNSFMVVFLKLGVVKQTHKISADY